MQPIKWYVGCSGFYYKEWKEIFYPKGLPQNQWFDYYCQHFNTLELNVTFYRFPELNSLKNWFQKSPDDYLFAVKVPKTITHQKKFQGTQNLAKEFYDVVANGLEHKLGPVLFQLPPGIHYSEEKLNAIIENTDPAFTNVIEFRHISWWRNDVMDILKQHNISFCGVSFPGLPDDVVLNNDSSYYRFHGVPKLYYSSYEDVFLKNVTEKISNNNFVKNAFLYFNNTAGAAALQNAKYIQSLINKAA